MKGPQYRNARNYAMTAGLDDAFYADSAVRMGVLSVEHLAHAWIMGVRFPGGFLFLSARFDARCAQA
jgi:hypothetical protein